MQQSKIYQWSDHYPSREQVWDDLNMGSVFGLMLRNEVLGVMSIQTQHEEEYDEIAWAFPSEQAWYLHRLAIHPRYQKKGLGRRMIHFAEREVLSRNGEVLRLSVYETNTPSLNFFERVGYSRSGTYYFPPWEDSFICMEKRLSEEIREE